MIYVRPALYCLISVALLASSVFAQTNRTAAINKIDAYVRTIDKISGDETSQVLVFADTADYDQKPFAWRRFETGTALDTYRETNETYTTAYVWKKGGKVVAANFTLFSPSGDWARYVYHFFRADGSAAKVTSELRTFIGDFIIIEDRYFDKMGRLLKKRVKYLDLTTHKPKKPTRDVMGDRPSYYKIGYFKTAKKLPFLHLMTVK